MFLIVLIMIITTATLISIGFTLGILLDVIITNNYLGNKIAPPKSNYLKLINIRFIYLFLILFIIFMIVLTVLNLFDITLFNIINENYFNNFNNDRSLNVFEGSVDNNSNSQGSNNTANVTMSGEVNVNKDSVNVAEGSVNVNTPNINLSIPMPAINKMVAAGSTMGAVTAGIKVAKNFGGTPATKIGLGLGTMAVAHTATYMMSNIYNCSASSDKSNNDSNNTNNYISNIIDSNSDLPVNILNEFPFNNLPHVDTLIDVEILLLSIFFNIFIASKLMNINYSKYIPNNKFGKLLNIIINRYISIWSKTSQFILIYTWILLFICVILTKISLYYIINN